MAKSRPNKHQAAMVEVIRLSNRLAFKGKCRCGWASAYLRATKKSASRDTELHIQERK